MKRLIKWLVILGVLFCVGGMGVAAAGAAMGGARYAGRAFHEAGWRIGHHWDRWHDGIDDFDFSEDSALPEDSGLPKDSGLPDETEDFLWQEETADFTMSESQEVENRSMKETVQYDNIREIEVESFGNVTWKESDELAAGQVRIEKLEDGEDYQYRQRGDELKILRGVYPGGKMNSIIISVSANTRLAEVSIEEKAGEFRADRIQAGELSLEAEGAVIIARNVKADTLELDAKAGEIFCQADVAREISVECDMGDVRLSLDGRKEDFSYEMECNAGQILLGGIGGQESYDTHWEREIINPGGKWMELECRAGNIAVEYSQGQTQEEDDSI